MTRLTLVVPLLWMLLLLPALCAGGELLHACECGDDEVRCEHEDACPSDPCDTAVVRAESVADAGTDAPDFVLALPRWTSSTVVTFAIACDTVSTPDRRRLPCPPSDVPLLS